MEDHRPEECELLLYRVRDSLTRDGKVDREAWKRLYEVHEKGCFLLARRIVKDAGLAGQCWHESFIKAMMKADQYKKEKGTVCGWLFGIVRHEALDEVNWWSRLQELPDEG